MPAPEIRFYVQRYGGVPCVVDDLSLSRMKYRPWECCFARMLSELRKDPERYGDFTPSDYVFLTEVNEQAVPDIPIIYAVTPLAAAQIALAALGVAGVVRSLGVRIEPLSSRHMVPASDGSYSDRLIRRLLASVRPPMAKPIRGVADEAASDDPSYPRASTALEA